MMRILDNVRTGDWLRITVNGIQKFECVTRTAGLLVETEHHRFTRLGRIWREGKLSIIIAEPASKDEVERWIDERAKQLEPIS